MNPEARGGSKNITAMIVGEEPAACQHVEKILIEEGCRVLMAQNGRDAVELAAKEHPQLILLEIVMPDMDGIGTLKNLRQLGERSVVIMLTASGTIGTAREAMMLGAYDYITKPFSLELLRCVIKEGLVDWESEQRPKRTRTKFELHNA